MPLSEMWPTRSKRGGGSPAPPATLIVGLGNLLLADDGVGVHAVRALQGEPDVWAVEVGTALLDGLHLFEQADRLLAIDAMQAGGAPGTIYAVSPSEVHDPGVKGSLHGLGLLATLRFLPHHRPEVAILAVEPERIDYDLELSPAVTASLPRLLRLARRCAADWSLARTLASYPV
ncbi:MAG: hydrogenase maturation protease [Candidatus Methylomirabilales bacterium]